MLLHSVNHFLSFLRRHPSRLFLGSVSACGYIPAAALTSPTPEMNTLNQPSPIYLFRHFSISRQRAKNPGPAGSASPRVIIQDFASAAASSIRRLVTSRDCSLGGWAQRARRVRSAESRKHTIHTSYTPLPLSLHIYTIATVATPNELDPNSSTSRRTASPNAVYIYLNAAFVTAERMSIRAQPKGEARVCGGYETARVCAKHGTARWPKMNGAL